MRSASTPDTDRGSVTAELVVALPAVLLVLAVCLSAISLGASRIMIQDAAADAARLLSRGESTEAATSHVRSRVEGAGLEVSRDGTLICANVTARGGLGPAAWIELGARGCALGEG